MKQPDPGGVGEGGEPFGIGRGRILRQQGWRPTGRPAAIGTAGSILVAGVFKDPQGVPQDGTSRVSRDSITGHTR